MRLLLLAPPGGGKGTQGAQLADRLGVRHVAAGDVLRAEARAGTPVGREIAAYQERGDLVPDPIVFDVLTPIVVDAVASGGGYVLDGFPRTLPQATAAAEIGRRLGLSFQAVVYLYVPDAVLVRRLLGRAAQGGRSDDTAAVIRHRLEVFATATSPLIDYYRKRGILLEVDGDRPPEAITTEILTRLSERSPHGGSP
jgi:adenylate kinase